MADRITSVTDPVTGRVYNQVEADFRPTKSVFTGKPWRECVRCGHVGEEGSMSLLGGKWYCSVSGCAEDVTAGSAKR